MNYTTDLTDPTPEQVAAVEAGVHAALTALGIDLDGRKVSIRKWGQELECGPRPELRGGTLHVDYLVKSPEPQGDDL